MHLSEPQLSALLRRNPDVAVVGEHVLSEANGSDRFGHSAVSEGQLRPIVQAKLPPSEEALQRSLIDYCHQRGEVDPIWLEIFHPATGGLRSKATAGRLKAMGCRKGLLDIYLLVPRRRYHGLVMELKTGKGRLTPEQRTEVSRLRLHGYAVYVVWSLEAAIASLEAYLSYV